MQEGEYKATVYNRNTHQFEEAASTLLCHQDSTVDISSLQSCSLTVNVSIPAKDLALLTIERIGDSNVNPAQELQIGDSIESKKAQLKLAGISSKDGTL